MVMLLCASHVGVFETTAKKVVAAARSTTRSVHLASQKLLKKNKFGAVFPISDQVLETGPGIHDFTLTLPKRH